MYNNLLFFVYYLKDLNMALYKADHCKSDIVLQFDSHYDRENKDELLKVDYSETVIPTFIFYYFVRVTLFLFVNRFVLFL